MTPGAAAPIASETVPPPETSSAAAPPRSISAGTDVIGLPTGTARLMATWMASLAAVTTAWLFGSPVIELDAILEFGVAALLLFMAVRLGLRAQLVLGLALGCGLVLAVLSIFGYGIVIIGVIGWAAFFAVLLRHARVALTRGVVFTAVAVLCGVTWAAPAVMGILSTVTAGYDLLLAMAAAVATWTFSAAGRRVRLRAGARLTVVRDAVFQVLALAAVSLGALWLGTTTETAVSRSAVGTPYESLAPTAGWFVLILTLVALGWSVLRLPRWLVAAQMRGRIESRVTGESLLFVTFACLAALLSWSLDTEGTVVGRGCVVALAAGAVYVLVRTRYATPLPLPNHQLWVIPVDDSARACSTAATVAAQWRVGQVTVLANPSAAFKLAGEHLRAADMTGAGESLFPTRPVHLRDWLEAQPAAWRALPLRELYAAPDLWARVLADVRPDTPVLALMSGETAAHHPLMLKDVGRSGGRPPAVVGMVMPVSQATGMRLKLLTIGSLGDGLVLLGRGQVIAKMRELRPAKTTVRVRHIVLQCAPADLEIAEDIASRIHGATDAQGRVVECWVTAHQSGTAAMLRLVRLPGGVWRHAMLFALQLIETPSGRWSVLKLNVSLLRRVLDSGWHGDFEVVVLESRTPGALAPIGTLADVVGRGAVQPVIALRHAAALGSLTYPASLYRGEILLPDGRGQDFMVAHAVQKLLATECQAVTVARSIDPDPVAEPFDESSIVEAEVASGRGRPSGRPAEAASPHDASPKAESHIHPAPWWLGRPFLVGAAIAAVVLVLGWLGYREESKADNATPAAASDAPGRAAIAQALQQKDGKRWTDVIDVLTPALATEKNDQLRLVMLRDRAYAYKEAGRLSESIADLTAALAIAPDDRTMLADRAFAEMYIRETDLALDDYARLGSPADALKRVSDLITPTQSSYLFVYVPAAAVNGPTALPDEMARLSGKWPNINLRFWWYPITANQVRYTNPSDEAEAKNLVSALREQGLTVGDSIELSNLTKRTRRIEVWLVNRKMITPVAPPVTRPPRPRIQSPVQSKNPYGKSDQGPPPSKK